MRAIGEQMVIDRYIGERHVMSRYIGEDLIFQDIIQQGLLHHFDGRNNVGNGVHNPDSDVWIDLVSGVAATLESVNWQNFGVLFANIAAKVFYQGQSVQQYTIFNTHMVTAFQGAHPRIFGEIPYPTLYLNSNQSYAYSFFGQGMDTYFQPRTIPVPGTVVQAAMRFSGSGNVELFYNGILTASIPNVVLFPMPVSTMYIGCRAENDRAFTGEIYEHLVYNRALSDAEVYHNYLVSRQRYQL